MDAYKLYGADSVIHKPISKEKTIELFKENTVQSREKIFEGNINLVNYVINKKFPHKSDKEELFSIGCEALWKSILNFDYKLGNNFSTYAVPQIESLIKRNVMNYSTTIKPSKTLYELNNKIFVLKEEYAKKNYGYELSNKEVAALLHIPIEKIEEAILSQHNIKNLEEPINELEKGDSTLFLKDVVATGGNIYDELEYKELYNSFLDFIDQLSENYKRIINGTYGINCKKKTQSQLAEELGLSQAQVSRVIKKFKEDFAKHIGIKLNVKNNNNSIKRKKKNVNTIYDEFNEEDYKILEEVIEKLPKDRRDILLAKYPYKIEDKNLKLSSADKGKAYHTLKEVIFNVAKAKISFVANSDVQKEKNNMDNTTIEGTMEELKDLFEGKSEKEILESLNVLNDIDKGIMEYRYGLNGENSSTIFEISCLYMIPTYEVKERIENAKVSMNLYMLNKTQTLNNNEVPIEKEEGKSKINANIISNNRENILKANNFDSVKSLILAGNFNGIKEDYSYYNQNIFVETYLATCSLASIDTSKNAINKDRAINKKCYVYKIICKDENDNIIKEEYIVKDKDIKKFYKILSKDKAGNYNFKDVLPGEIVCFNISNIEMLENSFEEVNSNKKISLEQYITQLYSGAKSDFENKNYNDASKKFIKLIEISGDRNIKFNSFNYLGKMYAKKGKHMIAQRYFEKALEIENNYYARLDLGKTLYNQGKYEDALECFNECDNICSYKNNHLFEKANVYNLIGDLKKSLETLNICLEKKGNVYNIHCLKAKILFEHGFFDEAIKEIDICDQLETKYDQHLLIKAKIEYILGNHSAALELFDQLVQNDISKEVMYSIIDIGYFFHRLGEVDLAYKYYKKTPMFPKWIKLTEVEIENHFLQHKMNTEEEKMHSIFNGDISLKDLNLLIKNMEKTGCRKLYDVYQIHWDNIGYMSVDDDEKIQEDFLTIYTLPFTKKIMMCYPDFRLESGMFRQPAEIDDLRKTLTNYEQNEVINDVEQKEKEDKIMKKGKKTKNFYSFFEKYDPVDIDKAFQMLSENQKQVINKRHNNDLNNIGEVSLTSKENASYYAAKQRIKDIIENNFNIRKYSKGPVKVVVDEIDGDVVNVDKETFTLENNSIDVQNISNNDEITETDVNDALPENKIITKNDVEESKCENNLMEADQETYLKLFELLNTPHFQGFILGKKYYTLMYLKLKFPNKTIKELSDFTDIKEEEIKKILSEGVDNIINELQNLMMEMLLTDESVLTKNISYVKDN